MNVAVIPARGGSKRIVKKNIKPFCGKPIIAYSIEAALQSRCFDKVIVSTDCVEIAEVARTYGAETPFMRDADLSDDLVGTNPVVADAILRLETLQINPLFVCCIYATAPLIRASDLRTAFEQFKASDKQFCFSVAEYQYPVARAMTQSDHGGVEMLFPEYMETRSQDLKPVFHDAGQFYWGSRDAYVDATPLFSANTLPYFLPHFLVQDIDTMEDWTKAEFLASFLNANAYDSN